MIKIRIKDILYGTAVGTQIEIYGWIRNRRESKNVIFVSLNDGSIIDNLQIVIDPKIFNESTISKLNVGTCIKVNGVINKSKGKGQEIELEAFEINIIGISSGAEYPLQPKKHSIEFLRSLPHLRMRTSTFGAIFRIKSHLSYAIHKFFQEHGFIYLHTPIITSIDAEGAGDMFQVTSFDLMKIPKEGSNIDFSKDFFGKKTNLTVSGQLAGETAALSLGQIYTFGPTFRAENSNTSRHLAEFWMIEPEVAFYELKDIIILAEKFLKYIINYLLKNANLDLEYLNNRYVEIQKNKPKNEKDELSLYEKLEQICDNKFEVISYSEAFEILKKSPKNKKKKFEYLVDEWGMDFQSEHERFLTEKHFKTPIVVTDYPKKIKAFYMYQNDDDKTVAAMDILLPGIGEIIGGSQREHRYSKLVNAIKDYEIDEKQLQWYIETRMFGTAPHSGFGLGLERLMLFITGMENVRDVIAFPRTPGKAEC